MTYKEFNDWCNQRACDGCWSAETVLFCLEILKEVENQPFWKRSRKWEELNTKYSIQDNVINPINNKMIEIYGKVL